MSAKARYNHMKELYSLLEECSEYVDKHSIGTFHESELMRKIEEQMLTVGAEIRRLQKCGQ